MIKSKSFLIVLLFFATVANVKAQWTTLTSTTTEDLHDIYFMNKSVGFAVGNNGTVVKTVNGGTSWNKMFTNTKQDLNAVFFADQLNGYIVGDSGMILKTLDGGFNWNIQPSNQSTALNSVYFINANKGIAVGDNGLLLRTINGGTNWNTVLSPTIYILNNVIFTNDSVGYAVGANGTILKTVDAGISWTAKNSSTSEALYGINFVNDTIGYAVGTKGTILKTTNIGNDWRPIVNPLFSNDWLRTVKCNKDEKWIIGGNDGIFIKSFSDNLSSYMPSGITASLYAFHFLNADTGFAVGSHGTILKTMNDGGVSVEKYVDEYKITVFPNPVIDNAFISYKLNSKANIFVEIYNLQGEKIQILLNAEQTPGEYSLSFNLNKCAAGIYFVRMNINNQQVVFRITQL